MNPARSSKVDYPQTINAFESISNIDLRKISELIQGFLNINDDLKKAHLLNMRIYNEVISLKGSHFECTAQNVIKDGYLTPSEAQKYLGMSKGTFDKYRYTSKIKIKGYQLDGKTWYKKDDLDKFMLTYQAKSGFLS